MKCDILSLHVKYVTCNDLDIYEGLKEFFFTKFPQV